MNARRTVMSHATARVIGLHIIALLVALGGPTSALAQTSVVFSQRLDATEDDRAPNLFVGPSFGAAVAIADRTLMVGMPAYDDEIGRVGIYTREADGWIRTATISNPDPQQRKTFGRDLALARHAVVVNADSAAYLFRKQGRRWDLVGTFGRSDPLVTLGSAVAYDGGFMARSIQTFGTNEDGSRADLPGVVRVYQQRNRDIRRVATLRASDAAQTDRFGVSLAMDRGVLVVGAPGAGAAYVFVREGQRWVQRQKLVSSDGGIGGFGTSVAIRNGMILVGAPDVDVPGEDPMTTPEGMVYAFLQHRGSWFESQRLNDDGRFFLQFGSNVALSQQLAAVVSPIDVPASFSRSTVIAFDRVGAELASVLGGTSTGSDGSRVNDVDASRHRIVAGVLESPNFGGPWSGWVRVIEFGAESAGAQATDDAR
jgi:hypothetical protein